MKTHVIRLDNHDDATSTRDRISWSKSARVLLVWPKRGRVNLKRLDLVLIQRHAAQFGSQLALVTKDREIIAEAAEVGIPVFADVTVAQRQSWRTRRYRRRWRLRRKDRRETLDALKKQIQDFAPREYPGWLRMVIFTIGVMAFLALVIVFLPSAKIEIKPAQTTQDLIIPFIASPDITLPSASGSVPAELVHIVVEGQEQGKGSKPAVVPDQSAQGVVTFTNLTEEEVEINPGTLVMTTGNNPVYFEVQRWVTLAAGVGKTMNVEVKAVIPGTVGNVPPEAIQAIKGNVGLRTTVTNREPMIGGTDISGLAVSGADYQQFRKKLENTLKETALVEFERLLADGDVIIPESIKMDKVIEEIQDPPVGGVSDIAQLTLRAEFQAWVVRGKDLQSVAQLALDANLVEGFVPVNKKILIESAAESIKFNGMTAVWQGAVSRMTKPSWNENLLTNLVMGQKPEEARQRILKIIPLSESPRLSLSPSWWFRMPFLPFRIEVVEYE